MKRAISRLFLPFLVLILLLAASPSQAMPLSEKASINRGMPFYLVVDMTNQYVTAYRSDTDEPVRYMICSTGKYNGTTPTGTFRLQSDAVYSWVTFPTCYIRYGKRITGSIWFHSILYRSRSTSSLSWDSFYNLGSPASHGCIRLTPIDAQWISYNCKKGTSVRILRASRTNESKALAKKLKSDLRVAGHKGIQPTLTPTPKPTLSLGSNNTRVKSLHSRLRSLGFYPGSITSAYTESTKVAVEAYQAAAGLTVTGEADSALQNKIANDNTITGRLTTLKYGDSYVAVKALQRKLKALGYLKASFQLSTSFNSTTRAAVKAFQTLSGLTPDGIATPAVQDQLFSDAAPTPTPSPAPRYANTTQLVSLRKSKSTTSTRLALIPSQKQVVVLTPSDGTWTKIRYNSKTGYALSRYLNESP
jgi:peptidoglycan hydrolase-like protein with peptidoglycan-binding domain